VKTPENAHVLMDIEQEFTDALEQCRRLQEESSREFIIAELGRWLGSELSLRRQTTDRMNIMELVRVCATMPRGLELLTDQVRRVDPLAPELLELAHLCEEWQAAHTLSDFWPEMRKTLPSVRLTDNPADELPLLRHLVATATGSRVQELPEQCTTLWRLFVYLIGANAGPGMPPPCMVLLDCIADRPDDPVLARSMRRWNLSLAAKWKVTELLDAGSWRPMAHQDEKTDVHLVIQLDPDPVNRGEILLSHWRQWDPHEWRPQRGTDKLVSSADLEAEVDDLIAGLEVMLGASADAARTSDIGLQFILPLDLLNFPVQHLRKRALADEFVPLALDHPIVIRSLERLRMPRLHLAWRRRWARMTTDSARSHRSQPSGPNSFVRLAAELRSDQVFSLILSEPPDPGNQTALLEIKAALHAGIPSILWHQQDCSSTDFHAAINTLVTDGALVHLPQRVAALRREALKVGTPTHPGMRIAILWDDPTRFPEPPRRTG
jgi:hypothetical protein